MNVIVAGGRDFDELHIMTEELDWLFEKLSEEVNIVSGAANGADRLGETYAAMRGLDIIKFPAEWDKYGKSAGYRRNVDMANKAQALVAFWDGKSKGTKHMIDIALERGLLVQIVRY